MTATGHAIARRAAAPNRVAASSTGRQRPFDGGWLVAAVFLLPSAVFVALFVLVPTGQAFYLSFFNWNGLSADMTFVGLQTFIDALTDPRLMASLFLTLIWWVMHLVLAVGGGLLLATLIARLTAGRAVFRTLLFLPHVLSLSVVGVVWAQIYHPSIGLLNEMLKHLGFGFLIQAWLGNTSTVLPAIGVASAWQAYGFYMVIYLAAIQGISRELYEAARMDGANVFQEFWYVTMPGLYNATTTVMVLAFISALKGFGSVWAMTQGGPGTATELVSVYLYREAFQYGEVSRAAAGGLILGFIVIVITMLFNHWRDRRFD